MENMNLSNNNLISYAFTQYHHSLFLYFYYSIGVKEEAEDLMQDSFLRLTDYNQMLRSETVKYFLFTIARNLKVDYLRRYSRRMNSFPIICILSFRSVKMQLISL